MEETAKIFYGCDPNQPMGSSLFAFSLRRRSTIPVALFPLQGNTLREIYREPLMREGASSEFAFTRFLAPYLCGYRGWSLFCDGADMLCTGNIAKLWELRDTKYAIQVVQQEHVPENEHKFLGQVQEKNRMKNWSSVMLFNNEMCRDLTPHYIEKASGKELHQFWWLRNGRLIGELPGKWNQLIDVTENEPKAGILHWTNGSPYFEEYRNAPCAKLWLDELNKMLGRSMSLVEIHRG